MALLSKERSWEQAYHGSSHSLVCRSDPHVLLFITCMKYFRHLDRFLYSEAPIFFSCLRLLPMRSPYKRYFDDIYLQTTIEEMADHFHHVINNVHPNLKFEIEKPETTPSGLSLSLLYFKVTISKDGNSSFEFYKKPAKKPLFVHPQSAIPTKSKLNFIRSERKRIEDRCSSNISTKQHLYTFDDILRLNATVIQRTV